MAFLNVGDCVLHYLAEGSADKPALVFSNSLGSDLRIWDAMAPQFAKDFRVIRYDQRGHGLSEAPPPPYSAGDLARDVMDLLGRLGIKEAVVCGLSVGGVIAQQLAIAYPDRVRALILCDTGARIGTVASWEERIATVTAHGLGVLAAPSMERWFTADSRRRCNDEVRGYANMVLRTSVDGYLGTCCALRDADFTQDAIRISQPTLVLCGEQDVATPPELGKELARLIPRAQFALIQQAAHLICIEQPDAVVDRMMQFFREVHIV